MGAVGAGPSRRRLARSSVAPRRRPGPGDRRGGPRLDAPRTRRREARGALRGERRGRRGGGRGRRRGGRGSRRVAGGGRRRKRRQTFRPRLRADT